MTKSTQGYDFMSQLAFHAIKINLKSNPLLCRPNENKIDLSFTCDIVSCPSEEQVMKWKKNSREKKLLLSIRWFVEERKRPNDSLVNLDNNRGK